MSRTIKKTHPAAFRLAAVYVSLCLVAIGYVLGSAFFLQGRVEIAGIFIVLLGLPWSLIITFAVLLLHSSSAWALATGYLLSCFVNAVLIYKLGSLIKRP